MVKYLLHVFHLQVEYAVWTEGYSADVTYYITDAGSVLNATYACSILKRLSLQEMSSVTTPFTVNTTPRPLQSATNTTPRPLQSTTSETSDDDEEYPSWFIPVVVAGSVGLVLLVVVIILYCRWKKGAPAKKILPQTGSPIEEQVQKPRVIELKKNTFILKLFVSHHSERDPPDLHRILNLTKLNKIVHYATVNNE